MSPRVRVVLATGGGLAAVLFAILAAAVLRGGAVPALDESTHAAVRSYGLGHPGWLSAWHTVTHLGDTVTILIVDVLLFVVCALTRRPRLAAFVAVVGLGGWGLRLLLRNLIARPRPPEPFWLADGLSFPSGHTTNAALMLALVVIVTWTGLPAWARWPVGLVAGLAALAVGFSRVAGGVHWPSDVAGGLLLATAFLSLVAAGFPFRPSADRARRRSGPATGPSA